MDAAEAREKILRERANIFAALAQRRDGNHQNIEAKKKIFAKTAGGYGALQIRIGESDQTRVHAQGFGAAETLESALFEHAQKLGLNPRRERGHFIENNRAALRDFKAAAAFARRRR